MEYQCTKERFLNDVKDHELTIFKDEGIYRHIRLSRPGSSVYRFDLLTWPGYLCVTGDMGCWTFSRTEDMFEFFIMDETDFNKSNIINPHYWEEKIQSISRFGGPVKEFNEELFRENVKNIVERYYEDNEEKKIECLEEVEDSIFRYIDDNHPAIVYDKLYYFEFEDFNFSSEFPSSEVYTLYYIWILYAIVWGILEYNKAKEVK